MIIRNLRDLVALEAFKFAGRQLQPGDPFQAMSTHARLLIAMGRATDIVATVAGLPQNPYVFVPPVAPPAEPPVAAPAVDAAPAPAEVAPPAVIEQAAEVPPQEASQAAAAPEVGAPAADADAAPAAVGATETPAAEPAAATRKRRAPASTQA